MVTYKNPRELKFKSHGTKTTNYTSKQKYYTLIWDPVSRTFGKVGGETANEELKEESVFWPLLANVSDDEVRGHHG